MNHILIEVHQILVPEIVRFAQRPLTAGIFIRPAVPCTWKIYPLGMPELIAHESQISVTGRRQRQKPYHLVEGHAPVHDKILGVNVHRRVHLLIHQPEYQRLVPHQSLVMALRVTYGLLVRAFVRQFPPDFAHAPLLVTLFLQPFYPVVCYAHSHPEIEAQAARGERGSKSRHSAHVLRDGYRIRIQFLCQHRGQCKIGYGIFVHPCIEIIVITDEIASQYSILVTPSNLKPSR